MSKMAETRLFPGEDLGTGTTTTQGDGGGNQIYCPLCGWEPGKTDLWACHCGHCWNTFDTGGVCPACLLQWAYTACLACHVFSAHADWYHYS